jgi:AIPR protein
MSDLAFSFRPTIARRIPDPSFKQSHDAERHLFVMPVRSLPPNLPLDPNARRPNIRKRVYQEVKKSLLNQEGEPGTFHLKNKGITIIAQSVSQKGDHEYLVTMRRGIHGIVDGGHTYTLVQENIENADLPEKQFVQVEVRVGVPDPWIPEIAGGLNTSVQVQDMSLDHLAGRFEWLKTALKSEPYAKKIAWSENDPGEYDARDVLSLLTMFNILLFPNDKDEHPVMAYEKKSLVLKAFEDDPIKFERTKPIIKDILLFSDTVAKDARDIWNTYNGGRGGGLAFMDKREKGQFEFIFSGKQSQFRLMNGALYPILAAFRWYVIQNTIDGTLNWRDGFPALLKAWNEIGGELLKATHLESNERGRNPNAIGKSRNHWANLHTRVAKFDLMARQSA